MLYKHLFLTWRDFLSYELLNGPAQYFKFRSLGKRGFLHTSVSNKELECPNEFIFDFIKDIKQDWDLDSFKSKSERLQKSNQ